MKQNIKHQRGDALMIAIIALIFMSFVGYLVLREMKNIRAEANINETAKNLSIISDGFSLYMKQNETSIVRGYRIVGVTDSAKPTFSELINLNYLPTTIIKSVNGSDLTLEVILNRPTRYGVIYTKNPVKNSSGQVDLNYLCRIAYSASEFGMCNRGNATATNSYTLYGRNQQIQDNITGTQFGSIAIKVIY